MSRIITTSEQITDPKLLARVRRLIAEEHPGYVRSGGGTIEHACIEPGCSCNFGVCGPFRDPPVRCTSFEANVLPMTSSDGCNPKLYAKYGGLEEAYWSHLRSGERMRIRRCAWPRCRRQVASNGPNSHYCQLHSEKARRERHRRYNQKRGHGNDNLASGGLGN